MVLKDKEITFHIENSAYTVNIGPDLNDDIINGLKQSLNLDGQISITELLSAFLNKNLECIVYKQNLNNTLQTLNDFTKNKIS